MSFLGRFQAIDEKDKAAVVRRLMESSTPNFDFFYLSGLAVLMAALGLLINSSAIVIGSMLIAPVLYPILALSVGVVMSNPVVIRRSLFTLGKSFAIGIGLAALAALLFGDSGAITSEIQARMEPSLVYMIVAIVAGLAVSYVLAQPEWNETLPGIAISVALIPPLATVGIGLAYFNIEIISNALVLLSINVLGIVGSAIISFSLMNLYQKQDVAKKTIKDEAKKMKKEEDAVKKVDKQTEKEAEQLNNV